MTTRNLIALATAGAVYATISAGAAFAQQQPAQGTTSGPAAGSNVEPGTVTQKKTGQNASDGAPGKAGPKGSENGPKPDKKSPDQ